MAALERMRSLVQSLESAEQRLKDAGSHGVGQVAGESRAVQGASEAQGGKAQSARRGRSGKVRSRSGQVGSVGARVRASRRPGAAAEAHPSARGERAAAACRAAPTKRASSSARCASGSAKRRPSAVSSARAGSATAARRRGCPGALREMRRLEDTGPLRRPAWPRPAHGVRHPGPQVGGVRDAPRGRRPGPREAVPLRLTGPAPRLAGAGRGVLPLAVEEVIFSSQGGRSHITAVGVRDPP